MSRPRWSKVFHDLWDHKARTLLVMLTIAVGVFAVGFVGNMFFVMLPELDNNYQVANPHGAIIYTDPFNDDLLPSLKRVPGVGDVEGRNGVSARVLRPNGDWATLSITGIPPVENIRVSKLRPEKPGETIPPLGDKEVYLERSTRSVLQVNPGDNIQIELADGTKRRLKVAGFVYDVTSPPFLFMQSVSAYASPDTLVWLGGSRDYNQIYMTVTGNKKDDAHVRAVAEAVSEKVEASGRTSYFTFILRPGRHFAADITAALGAIMMVLGGLSVALSAFLVINTLNALLSQQVRQIGVMKAVGASTSQLVGMYLVLTLFYGILSLAVAFPLSIVLSSFSGGGVSTFLNFDAGPVIVAPQVLALQIFVALVIPVAAATLPVIKNTHITVREAITNYGLGRGSFGSGMIDRIVERIRSLPRPFLISLRNTFRRKARLVLTLSTLVLAGAIFIGVFNLKAALDKAIEDTLGYILSDVTVGFGQYYRLQKVLPMAMSVPGVVSAEAWGGVLGSLLQEDQSTGTQIQILAPPADSNLIKASMISGRWLLPGDENALVIGNSMLAVRPELKVGDEVIIDIDGVKNKWEIIGVYQFIGTSIPPLLYTNNEYLGKITHQQNMAGSLRVVTEYHDAAFQKRVARDLETVFAGEGIDISQVLIGTDIIKANAATTNVLVLFLMIMAVLIAVVGGLGMTSTMSINVFERTREIGVMRAIGASSGTILRMVIAEGMIIGILSWLLGTLVAVPIGAALSYVVGITMLSNPLPPVFSLNGFLVWLALILVLSTLACVLPARNATRLTVREVLAYE
jgi:putative ABC transport system permease protein